MIQRGRGTMYTSILHVRYALQFFLLAPDAKWLPCCLELQPLQCCPENKHVCVSRRLPVPL